MLCPSWKGFVIYRYLWTPCQAKGKSVPLHSALPYSNKPIHFCEEESNSDNSCAASWRHFASFCTLAESNVLKCDSSRWSEQQLARRIHYVRSHWHVTSAKCYAEPFQSFPISISPWHTTTMLCKSCYHSRNEHNSLAREGTCCSKLQNSKGCSNRCCCRCHGPLAQMQWPRQESNCASVTGCIVIVTMLSLDDQIHQNTTWDWYATNCLQLHVRCQIWSAHVEAAYPCNVLDGWEKGWRWNRLMLLP